MMTKSPKSVGQSSFVLKRRIPSRPRPDLADHGGPIYCSRDQDFVWMAGLIDAVQAVGSDVGGALMKLIRPSAKK